MAQQQKWYVRTRAGNEFPLFTSIGMSFEQALASAGLMRQDVEYIRADGIAVVEDMRAWRGEGTVQL